MMKIDDKIIIEILKRKFEEIKERNKNYSKRSFAKKLNLSSGALTEILSGKRKISCELAKTLALKLDLNESEERKFLSPFKIKKDLEEKIIFRALTENEEKKLTISHFIFLAMIRLDNFSSDLSFISEKLGESKEEYQKIINDLIGFDLIYIENKKIYRRYENLKTAVNQSVNDQRDRHKKFIEKGIDSIDNVDANYRDISSITFASDPKRKEEAKKMIRDFMYKFGKIMESNDKTEVYNLNIQFFPLTQIDSEKK